MNHAAILCIAACPPCAADVTVTIEEVGDDVVISGGGTLDISLWSFDGESFGIPSIFPISMFLGPTPLAPIDVYFQPENFQGPASIPAGSFFADLGAGDPIALLWDPGNLAVGVPSGYISGGPIDGTETTFLDDSLASLGLVEGEYTWTWDTADGAGDSFTVVVVPATCGADVNGDGELNVLDFVAFQQLWQDGDPGADCDANGVFNVLDFVCFQQRFQIGCQ